MIQTRLILMKMLDEKINAIVNHFLYDLDKDKRHKPLSLLSGRSGTILLFIELFKKSGNDLFKLEIHQNLEIIYNQIDNSDNLISSYCDGLAGWGWLIEHLKSQGLLQNEYDSILEEVDDVLNTQIDDLANTKNFDLLHGLLGIGMYFFKRKDLSLCEQILLLLEKSCNYENHEVKLVRYDPYVLRESVFDLGLPHGMAGVLYYVNKCYEASIRIELCTKLMKGIVNFYFNNIQEPDIANSYFPGRYAIKDYVSKMNITSQSRLAWCYGDLIVFYLIYKTLGLLSLETEQRNVIDKLLNLCNRRQPNQTSVSDASFCHGSSGLAYIFKKLYKLTGLPEFNKAAHYWLEETFNYGNRAGFGGYLFEVMNTNNEIMLIPSSGILEGIGGIGLVLLSFQKKNFDDLWDECVFLS